MDSAGVDVTLPSDDLATDVVGGAVDTGKGEVDDGRRKSAMFLSGKDIKGGGGGWEGDAPGTEGRGSDEGVDDLLFAEDLVSLVGPFGRTLLDDLSRCRLLFSLRDLESALLARDRGLFAGLQLQQKCENELNKSTSAIILEH